MVVALAIRDGSVARVVEGAHGHSRGNHASSVVTLCVLHVLHRNTLLLVGNSHTKTVNGVQSAQRKQGSAGEVVNASFRGTQSLRAVAQRWIRGAQTQNPVSPAIKRDLPVAAALPTCAAEQSGDGEYTLSRSILSQRT